MAVERRRGDVQALVAAPVFVAAADGELEVGRDVPYVLQPQGLRLGLAVTPGEHAGAAAPVGPVGRVERGVLERVVLVVQSRAQDVPRDLTTRLPRSLQ